ncbi:hypothetical protein [Sphingomonas sp. 3-13AW]|uniref:hypothetical protein n=1 Tax=Sphingomonas sp. 3-13AW TaxID=3050450 RepID=UPI003BB77D54
MTKKPLSRQAIRAIAIRACIKRAAADKAAQGALPGIVSDAPAAKNAMHPRLLAMCVGAGGYEQNDRFVA